MILPSKHLSQDRALLTVGAHVLTFLAHPKTVSEPPRLSRRLIPLRGLSNEKVS